MQSLTENISQRLRKTDSLFRLGGEEFVILLPQQKAEAACQLAEILRQQIASLMQANYQNLQLVLVLPNTIRKMIKTLF